MQLLCVSNCHLALFASSCGNWGPRKCATLATACPLASDTGVSCLLPASRKLWRDNSLDCEQRKISDSTPVLAEVQFSSVQLLSCVRLFATPWTAARQTSLSITNSRSLLKLMSIQSVMPSNHLILCCPLLLLPSIFSRIRVFPRSNILAEVINPLDNLEKILLFPPFYNLKTKSKN